jgi:hypothetical protein
MKAKLIFDLEIPEDVEAYNRMNQSQDLALALWDICQLRKKLERRFENTDNTNNDVFDGIQEFADEIGNVLEEYKINLDNLVR